MVSDNAFCVCVEQYLPCRLFTVINCIYAHITNFVVCTKSLLPENQDFFKYIFFKFFEYDSDSEFQNKVHLFKYMTMLTREFHKLSPTFDWPVYVL